MRRTDDFIADLEAQLAAAAAAGAVPRRRRLRPAAVLRPTLVAAVAAAAAFAFVLAAGGGGDPERAAQPPAPPALTAGAPFTLEPAREGVCAANPGEPPREVFEKLSVLRAPTTATAPPSDSSHARSPRADLPVTLVPMADIGSCLDRPPAARDAVPGVCAVVMAEVDRSACFSLRQVEELQAAAALREGFLIALLPDGVREATFVIGAERDTYPVVDNVVIANLEGAKAGARMQVIPGAERPGTACGEGQVLDTPLPSELTLALSVLSDGEARSAPDHVMDLLTKAGASRIWAGQARWVLVDEDVSVWVVPVADSRFAECGEPMVTAPRAFEGPGACLVGLVGSDPRAAVCADLRHLLQFAVTDVPGGRLALGFVPHWADAGADVGGRRLANLGGFVAGLVPADAAAKAAYVGEGEPRHPVTVIGPEAEHARDRIAAGHPAADVRSDETAGGPTRVWYAPGMAPSAGRIAELIPAGGVLPEVLPMDTEARALAGHEADVLVLAGEDLRP